ncbi:hypothetical protein BKA56DRAFT_611866 [Ilyonectria sp. MPI-CAGE-AT-0026]|nr:hypothetical protein BKA56DRAFT_611866 [Ilyonectria sp. MPI-CAGE-AT-0026]
MKITSGYILKLVLTASHKWWYDAVKNVKEMEYMWGINNDHATLDDNWECTLDLPATNIPEDSNTNPVLDSEVVVCTLGCMPNHRITKSLTKNTSSAVQPQPQRCRHEIGGFQDPQPKSERKFLWAQQWVYSHRFGINCFKTGCKKSDIKVTECLVAGEQPNLPVRVCVPAIYSYVIVESTDIRFSIG